MKTTNRIFLAVILCWLVLLGTSFARAQVFATIEEANAHFNACLTTDWQVRHYAWNPCAATVSIKEYGLLLFGHKDSVQVYNLHIDSEPTGNQRWASLELATGGWQRCATHLALWQEHTTACHVYSAVVDNELAQTGNAELIPFVASRSFLAQVTGWQALYKPSEPPEPEPIPTPTNPRCDKTEDMVDGPGGAVWKPVSESDGFPVLLMPARYCDVEQVNIYRNGKKIADMNQTDCEEFGRGVWRGAPSCRALGKDIILVFGSECRTVPDACKRYD